MQVHQIVIRPTENMVFVLYEDIVGRKETLSFESAGNSHVAALVAECQAKLPPDNQHPAKSEIEQEIDELEYRLSQLKQSIGQT